VYCQSTIGCEFWSYEYENGNHECFLKTAVEEDCQGYRIWPFEDPHWQGASGPKVCPSSATDTASSNEIHDTLQHIQDELNAIFISSDCIKAGYDYGRAYGDCGYADTLKIIVNNPEFEFPLWAASDDVAKVTDETLATAADCQVYCQSTIGCEFWSYEYENGNHECFLKTAVEEDCQGYRIWPFEDPHWQGASGPKVCPSSATDTASSNDIHDTLQHIQDELNAIFISNDCIKAGYDYGRAYGDCGYADTIRIIVNNPEFEFPSWAGDDVVKTTDENLATAAECQVYCQNTEKCDFWSYEYEYANHECFLKTAVESGCQGYRIWPFEDPNWQGASGPKVCSDSANTGAFANTVASTTCDCDRSDIEAVIMVVGIVCFLLFLFSSCLAMYFYNKMMEAYTSAMGYQMSKVANGF